MISIIVAMDKNRLIGAEGKLPWHLPADLKFFKEVTLGQIVVMGSKTFESIGKPLPNRINMVLSRKNGCTIQRVLDLASGNNIFVIGGAEVYKQFIPIADRLIITHINSEFSGDTYFPEFSYDDFIKEQICTGKDSSSQLEFEIALYQRKNHSS